MKIIRRGIAKVIPGKREEMFELLGKYIPVARRYGLPPVKVYGRLSGGGDYLHMFFFETEWDSLAAMETYADRMAADTEAQAIVAKCETILESDELQFYTLIEL